MRILGFDWDLTNLHKLSEHDLDPGDVEWPLNGAIGRQAAQAEG